MLAYSTIGHTGFLFTAVAAHSEAAARAMFYYLAIYSLMNIGAFALVAIRERELGRPVLIDDFRGYAYRRPLLAIAMVVFMLSLAGLPPIGGLHRQAHDLEQRRRRRPDLPGRRAAWSRPWSALGYYLKIPFALVDRDVAGPGVAISPGVRSDIGYRTGNGGRGAGARDHSRAALRSGADGKRITDRESDDEATGSGGAGGALAIAVLFPATASARTLSQGMCGPDVHRLQHELGLTQLPARRATRRAATTTARRRP